MGISCRGYSFGPDSYRGSDVRFRILNLIIRHSVNSFLKNGFITLLSLTCVINKGFSQDSIPGTKKVIAAYQLLIKNPAPPRRD